MHKLIIVLFFVICTQPVWSVDNQGQLFVPDNIELALNDLTDTAHYELVKEYAQSLPTSDYDQFIALLETRRISASFTRVGFIVAQPLLSVLTCYAAISFFNNPYQPLHVQSVRMNLNNAQITSKNTARDIMLKLSEDFSWHLAIVACFTWFFVWNIMDYIDSRYAVTQQFHIISNLLNELKELHKAYDHQTF